MHIFWPLIVLVILLSSCREDDIPATYDMGEVQDYAMNGPVPDINATTDQYLKPPRRTGCEDIIEDDPLSATVQRVGGCVSFNMSLYSDPDSGAKISRAIRSSRNKKAAFESYFVPLAVYVQSKTGYPASALLAQWAIETAWGTSKQIRVNNNIGGHSCFKYKPRYTYPNKSPLPSYVKPPFNARCTYMRPKSEGGFYMTFANMLEASLSQVYNILHNPGTSKNYAGTRNEVRNALKSGRRPNPVRVINGLSGYAAFPPSYKRDLINQMKREGYQRYDDKNICGRAAGPSYSKGLGPSYSTPKGFSYNSENELTSE